MLDLNVDVVYVDSTYDESRTKITAEKLPDVAGAQTDDSSGTSNSSVVNADDAPTSAGDEDCSSTHTMTKPSDTVSAFDFGILNSGKGSAGDVIEIKEECNENLASELVTRQLFPAVGEGGGVRESDEFVFGPALLRPQWLNLTALESGGGPDLKIFQPQKQQPQQQQVKKSRRGPRSRSSQYRGVTFYRRTGRWESHIWDCGKQVYLGGFDTAHAAARVYDRAAIKFRGVDADINFHINDYEEDMKQQMKNLTKEEFVHVLRHHSTGFSRGSSKYRGVTLHKCGRWEARMGQFLGKKAYDKAAIKCNGREAVTNFEPGTYAGEISLNTDNGGGSHNLDLNLWISPLSTGPKGNDNVGNLHFQCAACEFHDGKSPKVEACASFLMGQTPRGPTMVSNHPPMWPDLYSGFTPNHEERAAGKRPEAVPLSQFSNWQRQTHSLGMVTPVPMFANAASSGFSSSTTAAFQLPFHR